MNTRIRTTVRAASLAFFGVLGTLHLGGCASSGSGGPATHASASHAVNSSADARFLNEVIAGSQWAIRMSDQVIANGKRKDVKSVASKIKQRESVNLENLMAERSRLGVTSPLPEPGDDLYMQTSETWLSHASGEDADQIYVDRLMKRRLDLIALANSARPELTSAKLLYFANTLCDERAADLSELQSVAFTTGDVPTNTRAQTGSSGAQVGATSAKGRSSHNKATLQKSKSSSSSKPKYR